MKRYIFILIVCSFAVTGCRHKSDYVMNYAYNDRMAFGAADTSYAAKFEVMWHGMNSNYAMWDYEYDCGVDWDNIYDEFYPQYEALDEQQAKVTDAQLEKLLEQTVAPLHDGHLYIQMKNHQTGKFVDASPGELRVDRERGDELKTVKGKKPILDYYQTAGQLKAYKKATTLNPDLTPKSAMVQKYPLTLTYALFDGNIAYLGFDHFTLSPYLLEDMTKSCFPSPDNTTSALITEFRATWDAWFNAIQKHQAAGDLGGVIIDIRSNGGGYLLDYQYVIGTLVPSGGIHESNARFKRGTGRLDYSPILAQTMYTLPDAHVTVTKPIVVLCNCASVSMAEHTAYSAKILENARLIGTRTHGGFCTITANTDYTTNYAGHVGEQNVTSVFCYIPQELAFTLNNEIVEGIGITPDIELPFDAATWNNGAGKDNQIDRALDFIRNGN